MRTKLEWAIWRQEAAAYFYAKAREFHDMALHDGPNDTAIAYAISYQQDGALEASKARELMGMED